MQYINIPFHQLPGALDFLSVDPKDMDAWISAINDAEPSGNFMHFAEAVKAKATDKGLSKIPGIVDFIGFVIQVRSLLLNPVGIDEFIDMVEAPLRQFAQAQNRPVTEEQSTQFKSAIRDILSAKNELGLSFKANRLLTQHERNYVQSFIISDLRPIFPDVDAEITEEPLGAVITHILKLEYMEGAVRKEFFIGLDESELSEIRTVVTRAERKAKSLRAILSKSGVTYVKVEADVKAEEE